VLLSDLHLGSIYGKEFLTDVVDEINQLEPDIVCIVGDVFNDDFNALAHPEESIEIMASIQSTYGTYACLGNHDTGSTFYKMLDFFDQAGIVLLKDEYVIVDNQFVIVGRNDSSPIGYQGDLTRGTLVDITNFSNSGSESAFHSYDLPVIVMDHQPSNIVEYSNETDLLLFGHSHRGQMFPASLITDAIFVVDYGYYQADADSPHVIVTSGAGTWGPPMRVGTDCEIVKIGIEFSYN
jgi:predicted MPP superfamily phosphohydrolase